jgi:hypothetical protein
MFTVVDMHALIKANPFTPFRLHLLDGSTVDVLSKDVVLAARWNAVIGLLEPDATVPIFDRFTIVGYSHVGRVELLPAGSAALSLLSGPTKAPSGAPA